MSTGVIVILIAVIVVIAAVAVVAFSVNRRRGKGGGDLRRRFGPEYDRVLARHDDDTDAAERELGERVRRYGDLRPEPLPREIREQYMVRWAGAQERFVESPLEAVADADQLLAALARARGFPGPDQYDEHLAALSVHHAHHLDGYRMVHAATDGRTGTEQMREAMVRARGLFDALVDGHRAAGTAAATEGHGAGRGGHRAKRHGPGRGHHGDGRHGDGRDARTPGRPAGDRVPSASRSSSGARSHWGFGPGHPPTAHEGK